MKKPRTQLDEIKELKTEIHHLKGMIKLLQDQMVVLINKGNNTSNLPYQWSGYPFWWGVNPPPTEQCPPYVVGPNTSNTLPRGC